MFAKIKDNRVVEWPIPSLTSLFPNTSFPVPLTPADMPEGYVIVGTVPPPVFGSNEKVAPGLPVKQGDRWVQSWNITPMTPEEIQQRYDAQAAQVREERNMRLAASDWTQLPDAPVDYSAWVAYRSELRTLTEQSGFPFDVQWPVQPNRV